MTTSLAQQIKGLPFLSGFSESLLQKMAFAGVLRRYKPSEPVYMQNGEPKAAYLIVSGIVNRESIQNLDLAVQHSRAFAGDWLGLANATSRITPYMHSAFAAEVSAILSFDLGHFSSLRSDVAFSQYLLQVAGKEQLAEEERLLNALSSTRGYDKLIRFLATEMTLMQKRSAATVHLPYVIGTHQYIAEAIGTARETVSRDMKPLIDAGIIERSRGIKPARYTILKQKELADLAASPLHRSALYENARGIKLHRRFSDVA